jgi:hypothetical protein
MTGTTPIPKAAAAGVLVGVCGWAIGLVAVALVAGRASLLWEIALPGALASLAMGLLLVAAWAGARARFGDRDRTTVLVLVGGLLVVVGMLLLLVHVWVEPVLARDPDVQRVLSATGSLTHVPPALAWVLLAAGAVLLGAALARSGDFGRRRPS